MATLNPPTKSLIEDDELRTVEKRAMVPGPICRDLSREGGVGRDNQDGGAIHVLIIALRRQWVVPLELHVVRRVPSLAEPVA
jgi:hypothetical protein